MIGANAVRRYFAVGELSPAVALVHNPRLNFRSPEGRRAIDEINRRLQAVENIAEVRSLTKPLGTAVRATPDGGFFSRLPGQLLNAAVESRYVSVRPASNDDRDHITRFDVLFDTDPFSTPSLIALDRVHDVLQAASAPGQPLEGTTSIGISGSSSMVHDLKRVTASDQQRMYVLVTLGVYAILVILLRRPGICLYLIATVVLGYLASLGLTDLVFHALHRGPGPWNGLDWTVGFFLFVILVAVGEDYNILLMARVIEEERTHGTIEGTAQGRRTHRRHHQLVRLDHGRHLRINAHGQPHIAPRTWIRAGPRHPPRHLPRPPHPRPRIRRSDPEDQNEPAPSRSPATKPKPSSRPPSSPEN